MLNVPLFDNLKKVNPASLNKIVPIPGDMMKSKLGISLQDEDKLIDNTFVYISTAFSNSDKAVIDEVIYPPPKPLDEVYKFIDKHGNDEERIKKFIGGLPNTYTFSKAFCESLVDKEHGNMRTIIVRPSIVTPSVQDPPGWCDSWVAATATFSDVSRGLTRVLYGRPDVPCNTIPVDYVCNLTLVAAARQNPSKDVLVYNCCGDPDNIVTWKRGADMYLEESLKYDRVPGTLRPGKVVMSPHPLVVRYLRFTRQTVPALLADCWLRIQGKQPRHLKAVQRAALLTTLLQSFTSTRLDFRTTRSRHLMDTMSEEDKVLFPCDPKTIIWKNYMKDFYCGVQKYLLNNK
ncbi:fatty acyl-CoA reductase 1-like isoform X2 [Bicyclus anynana]|uniref:Fatty acyl-CoA reductase n=1 Tax=Bicyclus anynana TaxID=110368 RepID=A0A6J1NF51_BICAN|nr:fatty acyl-CoA reductase 1-like isoform X2 [Bicyclus anynana]